MRYAIPYVGELPSIQTTILEPKDMYPNLMVSTVDFSRRFAVQITDDGLHVQGISVGDYLIFREQRWPSSENQICLVTFGDEVTIRVLNNIYHSEVTLRVYDERVPDLQLAPTDFTVIGVLCGVVKEDLAQLVFAQAADMWND